MRLKREPAIQIREAMIFAEWSLKFELLICPICSKAYISFSQIKSKRQYETNENQKKVATAVFMKKVDIEWRLSQICHKLQWQWRGVILTAVSWTEVISCSINDSAVSFNCFWGVRSLLRLEMWMVVNHWKTKNTQHKNRDKEIKVQ